ncbi:MAG: hypothetical protein IJK81_09955 [Selenomonadaceae bacterium]|nr:hypothetical protein [Selenomonadaceae bacterium]
MENLDVETRRGTVLNGVLFPAKHSDTVVIAITGIHLEQTKLFTICRVITIKSALKSLF